MQNKTNVSDVEEINRRKEAEIHKLVDEQLKKNMGYLNDIEKFKVHHAKDNTTTAKVSVASQLKIDNTTVDFDIPKRYRNSKCKPIVKKINKKKAEPRKRVVYVDVLEEKTKQRRAKRLIKIANDFIQNTNDDEYKLSMADEDFLNALDIN